MAWIECRFYSEVLELSSTMQVLLPQQTLFQNGTRTEPSAVQHPVLYLLHGLSDDSTAWMRQTAIERYAAPLGLAVVMPDVHRSYYADMAHGQRYWTFLSEELPRVARSFFPLSDKPDDNFVAGLSMGGYGAFKWALREPDRFAAAASLSGPLDLARRFDTGPEAYRLAFGSRQQLEGSQNDLMFLAAQLAASPGPRPALYQCCGTEDALYPYNLTFRDHCLALGLPLTYEEEPGDHEWGYWDRKIQQVLDWLPLRNNPE